MVCVIASLLVFLIVLSSFRVSDAAESTEEDESPVVQTTFGPVQGMKFISSWTNKTIYSFRGIPYASPPVGELRFKDPVPPDKWTTVKDCTQDQYSCPQLSHQVPELDVAVFNTSEDCLYLNVYSPEIKPKEGLLPVIFWIHGGGYRIGAGNYDETGPDFLVEQQVVVVTINYRLGALGLMTLGTAGIPGNAALKDQNLALRWVKREISQFGGDAGQVTLFGHSAGSSSVHLHYLSPQSKGLFHRVIGDSGSSLSSWAVRENGVKYGLRLAALLNCTSTDISDVEQCLRNASVEDIVTGQALVEPDPSEGSILVFNPTIDKNSSKDPFLPELPLQLIEKKEGSMVPFLMGINSHEGIVMFGRVNEETMKNFTNNLENFIPQEVKKKSSPSRIKQLADRIKKFYFGDTIPSYSNWRGFVDFYTDNMFGYSTAQSAKYFCSRDSVYLYYFCFNGTFKEGLTLKMEKQHNISGVSHAEELSYLFVRKVINQTAQPDSDEMKTWTRMVKMWTNFAKFGSPTLEPDPELGNISWAPVDKMTTKYLKIDANLTMVEDDFLASTVALWDSLTPSSSVHLHASSLMMATSLILYFAR